MLLLTLLTLLAPSGGLDNDIYDAFADPPSTSTSTSTSPTDFIEDGSSTMYDAFAEMPVDAALDTAPTQYLAATPNDARQWSTFHPSVATLAHLDLQRCDIPRIQNDHHHHPNWKEPFIAARPTWPADTAWSTPTKFLRRYGHHPTMIDTPAYFSFQGYTISRTNFSSYYFAAAPEKSTPFGQETLHSQRHTLLHGNTTFSNYSFTSFTAHEWPEMIHDTAATTPDHFRQEFHAKTKQLNASENYTWYR